MCSACHVTPDFGMLFKHKGDNPEIVEVNRVYNLIFLIQLIYF